MALPSPSGSEIILEKKATIKVPTKRGRTPKLLGLSVGAQVVPVRKSQRGISLKNKNDSPNRVKIIAIVVIIVIPAKRRRVFSIMNSFCLIFLFMIPPNGKKAPRCPAFYLLNFISTALADRRTF